MGASFETWGWRLPFLASIVLVGVGLWVRLGVLESPLFAREVENDSARGRAAASRSIKREPREIILSALLRMSEQAPFYIFTAFVLAYGTEDLGFSKGFLTNAVMVAAALSLFIGPVLRAPLRQDRAQADVHDGRRRRRCSSASRTSCCSTRRSACSW